MKLFKGSADRRMFQVYLVLLILCTATVIFGIFQLKTTMAAMAGETAVSFPQPILQSVLIAALVIILVALMLTLFFRVRKQAQGLGKKKAG
jgi:TRAP-type C4-dicarboxylate transport system permease small subunit